MNSTNSAGSDPRHEIEELARSLAEIKSAVRRSNPLLRSFAASKLYAALSLILGLVIVAFCVYAHFTSQNQLDGSLPEGLPWIVLVAFLLIGATVKIILTARIAGKRDAKAFISLVKANFSGKSSSLLASAFLSIAAAIAFLIGSGNPAYIVPVSSIFIAFAAHSLDQVIDLLEYRVMGWLALTVGILSLFFVESAPWLWAAADFGATFCAFGITGLLRAAYRREG